METAVYSVDHHALLESIADADDLSDLSGDRFGQGAVGTEACGQDENVIGQRFRFAGFVFDD